MRVVLKQLWMSIKLIWKICFYILHTYIISYMAKMAYFLWFVNLCQHLDMSWILPKEPIFAVSLILLVFDVV